MHALDDEGHGVGGDDDAQIAAAVEQAGGKGPLLLGVPFSNGLDRDGKVAAFGQAEGETGDAEPAYRDTTAGVRVPAMFRRSAASSQGVPQ